MSRSPFRRCCLLAGILLLMVARRTPAAEIYSNTTGGGEWSDPASWRGGAVPTAEDDVVISKDDVMLFDRNDDAQNHVSEFVFGSGAVLQFKVNAGPLVFCCKGLVDCYGHIRLDATKGVKDQHEFRLVAENPEQRMLKISKGGGLVVSGKAGLPKGRRNALITALPPKQEVPAGSPLPDPTAILEAGPSCTLDIQRAELVNIYLQANTIDNTGAKPGERINLLKNRFTGNSRVNLTSCDSGVFADNLMERDEAYPLPQPALYLVASPLIEIRGNIIRGNYPGGITGYGQGECVVTNNLIENCAQGLYWYGSDFMIKQLKIKGCAHGMTLTSKGTLEDITIEKAVSAYYHGGANIQMTNLVIRDTVPNPNGYAIYYGSGPLTLINSPIQPEDITIPPGFLPEPVVPNKARLPIIQTWNFVVAQVSGEVPPGVGVELKTAHSGTPLPPGSQDPNVRNSPAPVLKNGLTPQPRTLEPLLVRGWSFDADGKPQTAPTYQLNILAMSQGEGVQRKVLKSLSVTPEAAWYRADPNEKKSTLEISLP